MSVGMSRACMCAHLIYNIFYNKLYCSYIDTFFLVTFSFAENSKLSSMKRADDLVKKEDIFER